MSRKTAPDGEVARGVQRRGFILYGLGRFAEAASGLRQVLVKNPTRLPTVFPLAAALFRDGRPDEARRNHPALSTAKVAELQFEGPGERFIAARKNMLAALRELGVP